MPMPIDAGLPGLPVATPPMPPMSPLGAPAAAAPSVAPGSFTDDQLLEMWKRWKKESFDQRWVFERQWMRNMWYILNRQWIYFDSQRGQWQDKRMAKWIPRPVTNICKEAIQAVRANFASINYGMSARPNGEDNDSIIAAGVADKYAPILHDEHNMDAVMNEFDFNQLVYGNAWLHTCVNHDRGNGVETITYETCVTCATEYDSGAIADAGQKCAKCGGTQFMPAVNPDGSPKQEQRTLPKGMTIALSPFEIAFPLVYERYDLAPYTIRIRWRDKSYYEQTEGLQDYAKTLSFSKSPTERTMQIFKSLPYQNDLGIAPPYFGAGGANAEGEGIVEYDIWVKPCVDFPDGQVIRIAGDTKPVVLHLESEALPGPLPYTDSKGNPLFTFHHARYDQVGGRSLGSSLIDPGIQIQDQINQLDSHCLMIFGRMANPVWLEPKGAEVERFTGQPGLVVKWNPLVAGGTAKPERIPGEGVNASVFEYRRMKKEEFEELTGTFDLLKGQKPTGVEAYSALSLLADLGQKRHTSAFKERATAYKGAMTDALEIEREFGPNDRIKAVLSPSRGWAFEKFKKSDLRGAITLIIEDGTLTPKTSLGERAAIEHLRQLGLLNPTDSEQVMAIYEKFGQQRLLPGLDAQVQEAWRNMDRFETFIADPQAIAAAQAEMQAQQQQAAMQPPAPTAPAMQPGAPAQPPQPAQPAGPPVPPQQPVQQTGPLQFKQWYDAPVHRQVVVKWCISDRGHAVFDSNPGAEAYVASYLAQIDLSIQMAQMAAMGGAMPGGPGGPPGAPGGPPGQPGGAGAAMANSGRNAAGAGPQASGSAGAKDQGTQ